VRAWPGHWEVEEVNSRLGLASADSHILDNNDDWSWAGRKLKLKWLDKAFITILKKGVGDRTGARLDSTPSAR